jgi:hypothetical protein
MDTPSYVDILFRRPPPTSILFRIRRPPPARRIRTFVIGMVVWFWW